MSTQIGRGRRSPDRWASPGILRLSIVCRETAESHVENSAGKGSISPSHIGGGGLAAYRLSASLSGNKASPRKFLPRLLAQSIHR
jgi:hypothetical protein